MTLYDADLLLRGASLALAAIFMFLAARVRDQVLRRLSIALVIGVSANVLHPAPFADAWPPALRLILRMLAAGSVYCFWAICRRLFEDSFALRPWHAGIVAALIVPIATLGMLPADSQAFARPTLQAIVAAISLLLAGHLLWRLAADRRDDLVEPRRRLRIALLGGGGGLLAVVMFMRSAGEANPYQPFAAQIELICFLALKTVLVALLVTTRFDIVVRGEPAHRRSLAETDADAPYVGRLNDAMSRLHLYRTTGLTIGMLAERLAIPEHRLRQVINRRLGYRNFSDFLNSWRLREAAERLSDPAHAHLPILTIALDLGYGSIGPFNRAFKTAHSMTPSDFRRMAQSSATEGV